MQTLNTITLQGQRLVKLASGQTAVVNGPSTSSTSSASNTTGQRIITLTNGQKVLTLGNTPGQRFMVSASRGCVCECVCVWVSVWGWVWVCVFV